MISDVLLDNGFVEEGDPGSYEDAWTALCEAASEIAPSNDSSLRLVVKN